MGTLATVLRPELPAIAEDILTAIRHEVADYDRPLKGEFGFNVRRGVEFALGRFLDELDGATVDPGVSAASRLVYVELGRGEFREGRSLDALLSAYRTGARVAWRRLVDAGTAGGLPPETIYDLGEAIFAYIDEISAESVEGYTAEESLVAGERDQR